MVSPIDVNWFAVLVATASNMVLGGLWYGPILGKPWMKAMGMDPNMVMTPEKKKAGMNAMLMMVPLAFVTAYVLAHFVDYTASVTWQDGAQTGFWLWLGFQMPLILQGKLFENKKMELICINGSYQLTALLIQGAILAAWA
ncbi:MAG: DUF1761 domain-containing protein [Patescibacteria group bacterium]